MKYLYFSIHMFYKNIIKIDKWGAQSTFHYCNIVLSLFQVMILFSFIDFLLFIKYRGSIIEYHPIIPFLVTMVFFYINKRYYRNREKNILKEMSKKSRFFKNIIFLITAIILMSVILLFFKTGNLIRENNINI